jgi:hypothetical protein
VTVVFTDCVVTTWGPDIEDDDGVVWRARASNPALPIRHFTAPRDTDLPSLYLIACAVLGLPVKQDTVDFHNEKVAESHG